MSLLRPFTRFTRRSSPSATPVRRRPSLDVSLTGLIYCALMMFMGIAALNTQANLLFGVFGLMIGVLLVSGIISRLMLKHLRITREMSEHATVGKPVTITYQFVNKKRFWPSLSISLAELDGVEGFVRQPQSYLLHAAAGTNATVPVEVVPKRRGLHTFDRYQLSTSFPFGFIKRAIERRHSDAIIVYPATARVDPRLLALCQPAEKTGPTMRPRRGGIDEFYGLKEHRRGENPRFIYWRRSARTGVLVAKEMTQVAPPRLLVLVDTYLSGRTRLEHAMAEKTIAMAGSLISAALEQGLPAGVYAWTDGWTGIVPTRGKRQRRDCMALLARLPLNQVHDAQALLESSQEMSESGTTTVLVTGRDIELSLNDKLRSGVMVVSANSPRAGAWFKFEPQVDFSLCLPTEQEAGIVD
jgi:uncharacterized protein (DUF58 family)